MEKEKTLGELAKEFPNKTYTELEKYREKDRQQEAGACIMGEMRKDREKSTESEFLIKTYETEIWKLKQLLSKALQDTNTLEGTKRIVIELSKEKIILKKRAQEAQAKGGQLQDELDRFKEENNDLFNRIAEALAVNESHQKMNGKLQERLTGLEEENKKMHAKLNKRMDSMRKSGM